MRSRVQGVGCGVSTASCPTALLRTGYESTYVMFDLLRGLGLRDWALGFGVQGLGVRVRVKLWGLGFRVSGLGFRV